MSWIDVAILAVVVVLGVFGVLKGVKKSALSLGAFLIAFLLAFFLANVIAEAFLGIDGIKNFVLGTGFGEKAEWSLAKWIYDGVPTLKLSEKTYIYQKFYEPMLKVVSGTKTAIPTDQGLALYGAFMILSAICGVGIFIIVRFLLIIVTAIIKTYISKKKSVPSRIFGFVLGAARGVLWMLSFTIVFSCLGGYTFAGGINFIEGEYENNAVISGMFNDWAYGLKNSLLLPSSDMYGRIAEMVSKTESKFETELESHRLNAFIAASNLNYDSAPWSVTDKKKRKFDEDVAHNKERTADEFTATGFNGVAKAILDYNAAVAKTLDDRDNADMNTADSATFDELTARLSSIDTGMNELWQAMRAYEALYGTPPKAASELATYNNSLGLAHTVVVGKLNALMSQYSAIIATEKFGEMGKYNVPAAKKLTEEDLSKQAK